MSDYSPIDCGIHSELELLAMRCSVVKLTFLADGWQELTGRVEDIYVRDGAEYLRFVDIHVRAHEIRLDRIISFDRR